MMARSTAIVAAFCVLLNHSSLAQNLSAPNRVTVVGRTTAAINYQQSGDTEVDLVGTALQPGARGVANISPKKGHIEIDVRFSGMQRPTHFGSEYLTFVLWAITPEGLPRNLGELQFTTDNVGSAESNQRLSEQRAVGTRVSRAAEDSAHRNGCGGLR